MRRQRNMSQIKEREKSPQKELNEIKASKLPDTEFKIMVIRVLKVLMRLQKHKKGHRNHKKESVKNEDYNN